MQNGIWSATQGSKAKFSEILRKWRKRCANLRNIALKFVDWVRRVVKESSSGSEW
jgi:hypothetical protein